MAGACRATSTRAMTRTVSPAAAVGRSIFDARAGQGRVARCRDREGLPRSSTALLAAVGRRSSRRGVRGSAAREIDIDRYACSTRSTWCSAATTTIIRRTTSSTSIRTTAGSSRSPGASAASSTIRVQPVDHPLLMPAEGTRAISRGGTASSTSCSPARVGRQPCARRWTRSKRLAPDLAADPYWDAYKLLPAFALPPPDGAADEQGRWVLAARGRARGFERRSAFLLDRLDTPGLDVRGGLNGDRAALEIVASGDATYRLEQVTASGCAGVFSVWADRDRDGKLDVSKDTLVAEGENGAGAAVHGYRELPARRDARDARRRPTKARRCARRIRATGVSLLHQGCAELRA